MPGELRPCCDRVTEPTRLEIGLRTLRRRERRRLAKPPLSKGGCRDFACPGLRVRAFWWHGHRQAARPRPVRSGRPGLGAHARREFAVPVIGVAKSAFRTAAHALPVLRGSSARPLLVTAAGMPRADAAEVVRLMAGRFRVPDALRRADELARIGLPGTPQTSNLPD